MLTELTSIHNAKLYTYKELRTATEDFSVTNKIGEGGFGPVYKVTSFFILMLWFSFEIPFFLLFKEMTFGKYIYCLGTA